MNTDFELIGKTITAVVATRGKAGSPQRIWMLQFSDGSHVEFVSPSAKRRLIRTAGGYRQPSGQPQERRPEQAMLEVNAA